MREYTLVARIKGEVFASTFILRTQKGSFENLNYAEEEAFAKLRA